MAPPGARRPYQAHTWPFSTQCAPFLCWSLPLDPDSWRALSGMSALLRFLLWLEMQSLPCRGNTSCTASTPKGGETLLYNVHCLGLFVLRRGRSCTVRESKLHVVHDQMLQPVCRHGGETARTSCTATPNHGRDRRDNSFCRSRPLFMSIPVG